MFDLVMYYSLMKSINEVMLYGIQVKDDIFEFMIVSDICFIDDYIFLQDLIIIVVFELLFYEVELIEDLDDYYVVNK